MDTVERQSALQIITQRLVIFTSIILLLVAVGLYLGVSTDPVAGESVDGLIKCKAEPTNSLEQYKFDCTPYLKSPPEQERSYLVLLVFTAGLLGGFVSIQQRLPRIDSKELSLLASSWVSVTIIPINGGIFAMVLMLSFIGGIIQGELFPVYHEVEIDGAAGFARWLKQGYPMTGMDVGKLLFWSFVSGFSERFVPQIIRNTAEK
ncbi:hypothetical protein AB4259_18360 [Vibrio amylolyticus]|uniref:hypothetical protein n=1 Tax=Vibrio amylolyticus TaxID=2847292 RepID=UPI00354D2B4E